MAEEILICPKWPGRNTGIEKRKITCADCKTAVSIAANNIPTVRERKIKVICEDCGFALIQKRKAAGDPADVRQEMLSSTTGKESHLHPCYVCGESFHCWCDSPQDVYGSEFQSCRKCRMAANPEMQKFFT
jgi:hypothetical protein